MLLYLSVKDNESFFSCEVIMVYLQSFYFVFIFEFKEQDVSVFDVKDVNSMFYLFIFFVYE